MQRLGIRLNIAKLSTCQRPTTPQQHGCMRCRNYAIFNFQRHLIALSWLVIWLHCVSRCEDFLYCDNKSQIASLITCRHFCIHLNKKWIETLQKELSFSFRILCILNMSKCDDRARVKFCVFAASIQLSRSSSSVFCRHKTHHTTINWKHWERNCWMNFNQVSTSSFTTLKWKKFLNFSRKSILRHIKRKDLRLCGLEFHSQKSTLNRCNCIWAKREFIKSIHVQKKWN